jgi:predicted membrane channel-forming protein YqfA (hemolysin III family)
MEAYNAKRDTIEKVNTNIAEQKLNITIENNNVQTNKSYLKKSTIIFYVFLAVFVVSLAILVGTLRGTGTAQKKLTVAIIFAVGVIALIVMYFVVHKLLKEGFSSLPSSSIRTQINELGGLDKIQQLYMDTAWGAFEEYLSNTINLAFLMETYRKYGDISNAITKEYNYYDKLGVQLKQSSQTLHSVQTNDYRTSKILQYRVYLFIQILIIVSLAAFINIYTPNSPSLHNVVIVLAAFVSLFFVYLYIFNTNNLVHTDATKLYWGKPSEELLK